MMATLNIGHLSTAYHTNYLLMGDDTLSNDINRNINWILFGTGPAMVQAFSKKELDIGYMGLPPGIIGIDKGIPIKCIAGGHVEGTIMIAREGYKNMEELNNNMTEVLSQFKGKAIGVPSSGSIHDVILNHYLKKYNLIDEVTIKNYKQAEFIAIDMKKKILDGGVGTPALAVFASTILKSHIVIPSNELWANNPSYGIFSHENFIKENPKIIYQFLIHHKKASLLLRTSKLEAAEKISKNFEVVNKEYAKAVLEISPKYCIALSSNYVNATMEFVKTLYDLAYIKQQLTKNRIFDFKFIKEIHPENHHYHF